ncbi:MAG: hypothetical protein AAFP89_12290, partial [Bacteroidota bacterium]
KRSFTEKTLITLTPLCWMTSHSSGDYPSEVPFFLSGGLSLENIEQVMQMEIPKLHAIDVNSKFEIKPGLKNLDKLRQLKEILA